MTNCRTLPTEQTIQDRSNAAKGHSTERDPARNEDQEFHDYASALAELSTFCTADEEQPTSLPICLTDSPSARSFLISS